MKKNLKIIFLLLASMMVICMFVGCGEGKKDDSTVLPERENLSAEQSAGTSETRNEEQINDEKQDIDIEEEGQEAEQPQSEDTPDQPGDAPDDTYAGETSDITPDESAELCVHVESIRDNSVVGSKISVEPVAGSNSVIMVSGGGEDEVLISIHFEDDTSYVYRTIRNSGADVDTREGSFSDIGLNMILNLTGHYEGDDFYADQVEIDNVILD